MNKQTGKRRNFSREFKLQLMHALESGKSAAQVSREYEIHETVIYKWLREYQRSPQDAFTKKYPKDSADKKLGALERMVGRLHMENDILKQATRILEENLLQYRKQRSEMQ